MSESTLPILTHPALAIPGVRHAFFTRRGGVSEGIYGALNAGRGSSDDPAKVAENRRRIAEAMGVAPERLLTAHQVHSPDAVAVSGPFGAEGPPRADALATRATGLAVAATAADCGPVLFVDPEARVVGAAHAGWKGALTGVLESTLAAMEGLGARRGAVIAVLGPTIGQAAYEVGPEFVARFTQDDPPSARFFIPSEREGHARFDLPGYILDRLRKAGVGVVADLGLCTYADPDRFFSYRRTTHRGEPDYGRHLHAIALVD